MRTLRLVVQYDGTGLYGFQRQKDPGRPTVQGLLEAALAGVLGEPTAATAAGRTDAGVHATGQVVHVRTAHTIPAQRLAAALNHRLPPSVRVVQAEDAPAGFHARRDATSRVYCYHLFLHRYPSAMLERFAWRIERPVDLGLMQALADQLPGRRRWDLFGSPLGAGRSPVRTLFGCRVDTMELGPGRGRLVRVCFEADAYLYRMVRRLIGALVQVGTGELPTAAVLGALAWADRGATGERPGPPPRGWSPARAPAAPAAGLTLVHVNYGPAPCGWGCCGGILDTLLGVWLEWPRGCAR